MGITYLLLGHSPPPRQARKGSKAISSTRWQPRAPSSGGRGSERRGTVPLWQRSCEGPQAIDLSTNIGSSMPFAVGSQCRIPSSCQARGTGFKAKGVIAFIEGTFSQVCLQDLILSAAVLPHPRSTTGLNHHRWAGVEL